MNTGMQMGMSRKDGVQAEAESHLESKNSVKSNGGAACEPDESGAVFVDPAPSPPRVDASSLGTGAKCTGGLIPTGHFCGGGR